MVRSIIRRRWLLFVFMTPSLAAQSASNRVRVEVAPATVLIEQRDRRQILNCDLVVTNEGPNHLRIWEIMVDVFDSTGQLALRRTINSNGFQPSIALVAPRMLEPHTTIDIFNPFFSYDGDVPLAHLRYTIRYLIENGAADSIRNRERLPFDSDVEGQVDVYPHRYVDRTPLALPLRGRLLVWDGHDFFSHHRRIPLHDPRVARTGMRTNDNRYAIDLIAIDSVGRAYTGSPYRKENWLTYGLPIYAPGAGRVVATANDVPDNWFEGTELRSPDLPDSVLAKGNFVVIDHGDGEYSVFPHMELGTVRVKPGDMVTPGEIIGRVGFSGDAIFPHVHYTLVNSANLMSADGLPIAFRSFRRLLGSTRKREDNAPVDSGDIIKTFAIR